MNEKIALGFGTQGYITIFTGNTRPYNDWFKSIEARYSKFWGWYLPEDREVYTLPFGVSTLQLKWNDITNNNILKPQSEITQIIDAYLYIQDNSNFVGTIGEQIKTHAILKLQTKCKTKYGFTNLYVFDDLVGNHLVWVTNDILELDKKYKLIGNVARHNLYKNSKQTVLKKVRYKKDED